MGFPAYSGENRAVLMAPQFGAAALVPHSATFRGPGDWHESFVISTSTIMQRRVI
jgi:hypothetical protein